MARKMSYKKQIQQILKNFDFDKLAQVYKAVDHKWAWTSKSVSFTNSFDRRSTHGFRVPTRDELEATAKKLLEDLASDASKASTSISSGGLHAIRINFDTLGLEYTLLISATPSTHQVTPGIWKD